MTAVASRVPTHTDLGFAETLTDAQPRPRRLPTDISDHINQYELIRELGRGGMGAVYLARDTKLARRVAIKLVLGRRPALNERFILEARATARCSHENIVVIHEVNEYRGTPFMVLEYLEGQSLGRLLATRRLTPQQAVELMIPVARALVCAHAHDIVHRDLKPDNVFVTTAGTIKVLDFGLAKLLVQDAGDERGADSDVAARTAISSTATGMLMGTLPYMSPEQWQGVDVDHRTDLWSAGIILYEMIVGHHPLGTLDRDTLATTGELDRPMPHARDSGVAMPEALAALIDRCLVKPREQRIASAQALLDALEALRPARPSYQRSQGENPYLGLHSFQESDADRYFGRTREIDEVLARLRNQPLVGVTGPTGIGKSSFVRAGVIAALASSAEPWEATVVRPGRDPLSALAAAVAPWASTPDATATGPHDPHDASNPPDTSCVISPASVAGAPGGPETPGAPRPDPLDPHDQHRALMKRLCAEPGYLGALLRHRARAEGRRILLVVDPFEELYTLGADGDTRLAFTACLAGAADDAAAPVRVLVSVRSDFLDRVAEDRHFLGELMSGLLFLAAPDRRGLEEALTQPADMAGYRFESQRMINEILDSVEAAPGSLPLLQFVATKLWELRDAERCLLTEESYCDIGGIFGALASHADAVVRALAQLSPHGLDMVRAIFGRLVTAERTRAIASLEELRGLASDAGEVDRVIDGLVDARLLIVQKGDGSATVEIVHDSLIHSWPRLRRWLEDSQEDLVFLEQLRAVAKRWDATGRAPGLLWRDEAVREARRWHGRHRGTLAPLEQAYLDAAFALADRARRLRHMALAGTLALLAMLCAGAFWAARRASDRAAVEAGLRHELQDRLGALQDALANLDRSERARHEADALLAQQEALLVEHAAARQAAERAAEEATARAVESRRRLVAMLEQLGPAGGRARAPTESLPGLLEDVMSRIGRTPATRESRPGTGYLDRQGHAATGAMQLAQVTGATGSRAGAPAASAGWADTGQSGLVSRMEQELERMRQALALAQEQLQTERNRLGRELADARGRARTAEERAAGEIERAVAQAEKARDRLERQLAKERARNQELENRIGKLNRRLR